MSKMTFIQTFISEIAKGSAVAVLAVFIILGVLAWAAWVATR